MIVTLWLIFLFWSLKYFRLTRKPKRKVCSAETAKEQKQLEKEKAISTKKENQIRIAEIEKAHCIEQLETLERMHETARKTLYKAQETVNTDMIFQAARTQKIVEKHVRELEKTEQKILSLNAKITMYQIKLEKAQNIIDSARKE